MEWWTEGAQTLTNPTTKCNKYGKQYTKEKHFGIHTNTTTVLKPEVKPKQKLKCGFCQ